MYIHYTCIAIFMCKRYTMYMYMYMLAAYQPYINNKHAKVFASYWIKFQLQGFSNISIRAGRQFFTVEEMLFSAHHASYEECLEAGTHCFLMAIEVSHTYNVYTGNWEDIQICSTYQHAYSLGSRPSPFMRVLCMFNQLPTHVKR